MNEGLVNGTGVPSEVLMPNHAPYHEDLEGSFTLTYISQTADVALFPALVVSFGYNSQPDRQAHVLEKEMNMKTLASPFVTALAVVALTGLTTMLAHADPRDFTLINGSSSIIAHVYVSAADVVSWEEDILGQDILEAGDAVHISFGKFSAGNCMYDVKVVTLEGSEGIVNDIDLCSLDTVTVS